MNNEEKLIKMLKYVSEHNDFYKNHKVIFDYLFKSSYMPV